MQISNASSNALTNLLSGKSGKAESAASKAAAIAATVQQTTTASDRGEGAPEISEEALALAEQRAKSDAFTRLSVQARTALDAQYKAATADGSEAVTDTSKGGTLLDLSSFSDESLAAVALDRSGIFTDGERAFAQATMNQRLADALAPFNFDTGSSSGQQSIWDVLNGTTSDSTASGAVRTQWSLFNGATRS